MTGLLRCQAVELVKCRTHALVVPADADLVIEGYLDPEASTAERCGCRDRGEPSACESRRAGDSR